MSDTSQNIERQPRAIHAALLLVTSGLSTLVTAVLGPSLPKMQAHFADVPDADFWVPLSMTVPMLVMAVLSIVMGGLADRFGRKRLMVAAGWLYALFGTAPLWLPGLTQIFASRVVLGIAEATLMTISTTMIGDYYPQSRCQKLLALQTTVAAASAFVLNLLGGVIGEMGWRAPYVVYLVSAPLALLMMIHLWEPRRETRGGPRRDAATESRGTSAPDCGAESGALNVPRLVGICGVGVLVGIAFLIVPVHLGYLFGLVGVSSTAAIGIAYGLNSIGVIAGTLVFGWLLAGRLSVPAQLATAALLTAAGFGGMALADSYASLTVAAMLNGFGAGLLLPTVVTWNMRGLPFEHRGLGVGAFQSCLFLGMFLNPILVVSLEHRLGTRAAAIGVIAVGVAAAGALALLVALMKPARGSERSLA